MEKPPRRRADASGHALDLFLSRFSPGAMTECSCGRPHEIKTRVVLVKSGAVAEIPSVLARLRLTGKVVVTFDTQVRPIAQAKVLPVLAAAGVPFDTVCLEPFSVDAEIQADLVTAGELMRRLPEDVGLLMAVGSGTMNDLAKYAAAVRGLPYVSVASAGSMNGYTSSITALADGLFKTTQETNPAVAVIADVDILKDAPLRMTRAGLGDLVSKWVCNADWKLSNLVRKTYFCDVPFGLIRQQEKYYMTHAAELGRSDASAVQALAEAIMISGFSMSIVGVSSPSSGAEHLIGHSWEMRNHLGLLPGAPRLHGAQVGVATCMMVRLYEMVAELDPRSIEAREAAARYPTWDEIERRVKAYYGPIAPKVLEESRQKYPERHELELELEWVLGNWSRLWKQLKRYRKSSTELVDVLTAACAPCRPADLDIGRDETLQAILHARYMRTRYTILDFAEALGVLDYLAVKLCDEYC